MREHAVPEQALALETATRCAVDEAREYGYDHDVVEYIAAPTTDPTGQMCQGDPVMFGCYDEPALARVSEFGVPAIASDARSCAWRTQTERSSRSATRGTAPHVSRPSAT